MNKENEIEIRFEVKDKKIFQEFSELNKVLEFEKASEKKTLIENQIFDDKKFSHAKKGILFRIRKKMKKFSLHSRKEFQLKKAWKKTRKLKKKFLESS